MKVSRLLMAAILASACSGEPAVERDAPAPATEPAPAPAATTGEEAAPQQDPSEIAVRIAGEPGVEKPEPSPRARRVVESAALKDERAAARGEVTQAAAQAGVNADGAILLDFKARIDKYVEIHKQATKDGAKLKETEDPAEIIRTQEALAARIRAQRADAKQGDIFTAEIRNKFRHLLAPELKGEDGRDAKAVMKDDAPAPASIPFKVNAKYPEGQPLPTVPASVLLNLPTLPEPLEYRIIGKHLVLLDMDANIVVDYIPNAIT